MGGDFAPTETVAGAVVASRRGVDVVLVGQADRLAVELENHGVDLPIIDAPDVIEMGDDPAKALRDRPNSSISVCARLVASGEASGFVSAGSTGAAMAAAAILIGRIKGVIRPAIATIIPTPGTPTMVLDSGANPEVSPEQLAQFGVMGSLASQVILGVENPRVALMSIGEEKSKGRDLERAAWALLEAGPTNFIGNVEGRDVSTDKADVFVTDGFTGNVFLKTVEGAAKLTAQYFFEALSDLPAEIQSEVMPALFSVRSKLDYETHGGAQLLGVKGVTVIAHGSSSRVAISNALTVASEGAAAGLPGRLAELLG